MSYLEKEIFSLIELHTFVDNRSQYGPAVLQHELHLVGKVLWLVLLDVDDGVLAVVLGVVTRHIGQLHHLGAGHHRLRRPSGQFTIVILNLSRQNGTTLTFQLLSPISRYLKIIRFFFNFDF